MTVGLSLQLPAAASSVAVIRSAVETVARDYGLSESRIDDVRLAVSEAATNAVLHGSREDGEIRVQAHCDDRRLVVVVSDDGAGTGPRHDRPGMGLGLPIIAALASTFDVIPGTTGNDVHMTFGAPAAASWDQNPDARG